VLGILVATFAFGGYLLSRKSVTVASANGGAAMVNKSIDALKDLIFKLELRRQAGTISEAEYSAERAKAEQILRDLVRG
jgi:hypothetical protein